MSTADHKRIESLFETFAAAWNRRDAQAMAAFYAEDGALIDPLGQEACGRAATLVAPAGDWHFSDVRPYAFLPPPPA